MDEGQGFGSRWIQLVIRCPKSASDLMAAWFVGTGSVGIESLDEESPNPPEGLLDDQLELRASFGYDAASADELLHLAEQESQRLAKLFPGSWTDVELCLLKQEDWANSWREHSHPVHIGRFFIHPGWIEPDSSAPFSVRIDPGMAFGTGLHPSTRMCMEWMDRILQERGQLKSLVDVGCGSGVLAIGAALAGIPKVVAVDTDQQACRVTRENMVFNGVQDSIQVLHGGPEVVKGSFSLVLANILSGVLVELRHELSGLVAVGGDMVLSGVLGDEGQMVREAFEEQGLIFMAREDEAEWCSLRMARV